MKNKKNDFFFGLEKNLRMDITIINMIINYFYYEMV